MNSIDFILNFNIFLYILIDLDIPAHWVAITNTLNQYIIEHINYLFVVYANDSKDAAKKLVLISNKVGFLGVASDDHTNGYSALIGDKYLTQLTNQKTTMVKFI